jgi:hypothetical protein
MKRLITLLILFAGCDLADAPMLAPAPSAEQPAWVFDMAPVNDVSITPKLPVTPTVEDSGPPDVKRLDGSTVWNGTAWTFQATDGRIFWHDGTDWQSGKPPQPRRRLFRR